MKKRFIPILIVLCLCSHSCAYGQERNSVPEHLVKKTVGVGKQARTYYVFAPEAKSDTERFPVVFVFHGGGGNALEVERVPQFRELAKTERFIAVYPEAIKNNWNDGRESKNIPSQAENVDDLSFVRAMLDKIKADYKVDAKRIFSMGASNGGIFSHYVGANLSEDFAAIAPVIGGIADPFYKRFDPKSPVSVFIIQGTEDKLVKYDGGFVARNRGKIISTDDAIALWTKSNKTDKEPVVGSLPDADKKDGCKVETYSWKNGTDGTEVLLYKAVGAGHTWPGGQQYAPRLIVGRVCRDFDATEAIWKFFKNHPKK